MSIRQSTVLTLTLLAGAITPKFTAQGTRVTVTQLTGANTLQCAIDGGSSVEIAPGFPINTGLEQFATVQFSNPSGASISFVAEVGFNERPDNRTYIPTGAGLPVSFASFTTFTATKTAVASAGVLDQAANANRRSGAVYNDGAGQVWFCAPGAVSDVGVPIASKATLALPDGFTGGFRVRNDSGASCDIHVSEFTA